MALKVKELQAATPGEWLSDGPAGSGRGSGVLLFRRTESGAVLAYFRYTLPDGKRDTLPVGQYDEKGRDGMTLAAAREKAGALAQLYQSGVRDIRVHLLAEEAARKEEKRAIEAAKEAATREAEVRQQYTLRALCESYVAHLERIGKGKSGDSARSVFSCHVFSNGDVSALPARDVTAHHVAALVRKVRETGKTRTAGVLRSYLSAAFNCAKRAPFDSAMPADLIPFAIEHNPADAIPTIPVNRGDRTLTADELRTYIKALGDDLPDMALRLALLAGGQRMAQLLRAKVSDYDADTATLRLWDGKGKRVAAREHLLPLAPNGAALVAGLVKRARKREEERAEAEGSTPDFTGLWLFSTHGRVKMTETTPGNRAKEICTAMKCEAFDLRDIRRTVETMLAGMGISKDTRAQLLSHGLSGVQNAHYDRHSYTDEKRAALVAWEARLAAIEKNEQPAANVVALRQNQA